MALTKSLSFSLGRKRILISNHSCNLDEFCADFDSFSPLMKRPCNGGEFEDVIEHKFSLLEALPHEILIKVICGVDHDDLKQLFHVSKAVRDATIVAKHTHFAYSTPTKTKAFRNSIDLAHEKNNNAVGFEDSYEAPNAPKQARRRNRPRVSKKKLGEISVALFASDEEEGEGKSELGWPRRSLFT